MLTSKLTNQPRRAKTRLDVRALARMSSLALSTT